MNHSFSASRTLPNGIRVTTVITVPDEVSWPDVGELGEVAQMASNYGMGYVMKSTAARAARRRDEEMPF
jgi:hypothetical protein